MYSLIFLSCLPLTVVNLDELLSSTAEQTVRRSVYNEKPCIEIADMGLTHRLVIPDALMKEYKNRPQVVLATLLAIMEGARPRDSKLAFGYAISLLGNAKIAPLLMEYISDEDYDSFDKTWQLTPRKHFVKVVKTKIKLSQ